MKHAICILLVILSFGAMESNASTLIGDMSCKQWLDGKNKPADAAAYTSWLQGYLSGADAMYENLLSKGFLNSDNKISVSEWTDLYCQKFPESMLHDSANALIKSLLENMPYF